MIQENLDDIVSVGSKIQGRFGIYIRADEYKSLCACTGHLHHCNPRRYFRRIFGRRFSGFSVIRIDGQYYSPKRIKDAPRRAWWTL